MITTFGMIMGVILVLIDDIIADNIVDVNNRNRILLQTITDTPVWEEWIKEQCGTYRAKYNDE